MWQQVSDWCYRMSNQKSLWRSRWIAVGRMIHRHLVARGLGSVAVAFSDALRPLAPAMQQLLWVTQPLAGALGQAQSIGALADLLGDLEDDPLAEQETLCSP